MQNKSHAVMAQRIEPNDSLDDFPTPPWATRGLVEHVLKHSYPLSKMSCWEPACGAGHMSRTLQEYFGNVISSDAYDYGFGAKRDFLTSPSSLRNHDWIITNPPFRLAEQFVLRALPLATVGVAIFARTVFIESVGRYEKLFSMFPPTKFAQFTERVPLLKGRLDRKATTATGYCWLIWEKSRSVSAPELVWIPPCRKYLERASDYARYSPNKSES